MEEKCHGKLNKQISSVELKKKKLYIYKYVQMRFRDVNCDVFSTPVKMQSQLCNYILKEYCFEAENFL